MGGGEFNRDCERGKPQEQSNRSMQKGHFLQTKKIKQGFLGDLNPELNLKELGQIRERLSPNGRKQHIQRHKGIRRAGSLLWIELNPTGKGETNGLEKLSLRKT